MAARRIITLTMNPSLDEWVTLASLRTGELNRAGGFIRHPGGKGINVSRVVRELGGATAALAVIGGEDGRIFRALMERVGVPCRYVDVDGATRNNYKVRTRRPSALTEINTAGPRVPARARRQVERELDRLCAGGACLVASGSLPPGVPASWYRAIIRRARRRRIPVVLDASGRALELGLQARPWMIKPNRHEAEALLGERLSSRAKVADAARRMCALGTEMVVLSLGGEGAVLAQRGSARVLVAEAPRVRVDSAVGAGDSLVAGFVTAWLRGRPVAESFRFGVACGTAAAMTPGTELCRRRDVERVFRRVKLVSR
ncbi:MAG TPA: 1-phosphofructokinase [bacterium]